MARCLRHGAKRAGFKPAPTALGMAVGALFMARGKRAGFKPAPTALGMAVGAYGGQGRWYDAGLVKGVALCLM